VAIFNPIEFVIFYPFFIGCALSTFCLMTDLIKQSDLYVKNAEPSPVTQGLPEADGRRSCTKTSLVKACRIALPCFSNNALAESEFARDAQAPPVGGSLDSRKPILRDSPRPHASNRLIA
jgi:hypothetical protein